MNEEDLKNFEKAGDIAAKAREFGKTLCKENILTLEIAEKIEAKIRELGGKPAFPVDVSLNYVAAHASPLEGDKTRLKKGDLVKLDIGVHIDGCPADTACTVEVGTDKYKDLILAAEEALDAAIKIARPGTKLFEVGKVIQEKIKSFGFSPIRNLSGHGLEKYEVHSKPTIPNYDNGDKTKLEKGMIVAIEPFATTGVGEIKEGKPSGVFSLIEKKPTRLQSARKILDYVEKEFKTLPFAARWLKSQNVNFVLRILERDEIIKQYSQLPEKSKGMVSQAEHTLLINDEVKILTK